MPIPKPSGGESQSKFIGRCMSAISGEYSQNVALGICYSQWGKKEGEKMQSIVREDDPVRLQTDRFMGGGEEQELPDAILGGSAGEDGDLVAGDLPKNLRSRWDEPETLDDILPIE